MLHYKIRTIKSLKDQKVKYYPAVANLRVMKFKDIIEHIVARTHLTSPDVVGGAQALSSAVSNYLRQGRRVKLGELGSFYLGVRATEGMAEKEKVTANNIKNVRCRYLASSEMKKSLATSLVGFKKREEKQ